MLSNYTSCALPTISLCQFFSLTMSQLMMLLFSLEAREDITENELLRNTNRLMVGIMG